MIFKCVQVNDGIQHKWIALLVANKMFRNFEYEGISLRSIRANHYIVTYKSVHAIVFKFVMKENLHYYI